MLCQREKEQVKAILRQYSTYKSEIEQLNLTIKTIDDLGEYDISGINYEKVFTSKTFKFFSVVESQTLFNLHNREKTLHQLNAVKTTLEFIVKTIDIAINSLDDLERKIIKYRFLEKPARTWQQIEILLDYDYRHLTKKMDMALESIYKHLNKVNLFKTVKELR